MKCFKCGNNVLPGSSSCPCCGSIVNRRIEQERARNKKVTVQSYREKKKNINTYNRTNTFSASGNNVKNGGTSAFAGILIFIFFVLPFISIIFGIVSEFSEIENYSYDINENIPNVSVDENKVDYLKNLSIDKGQRAKSGDLVFVLENKNNVDIDVTLEISFYDANNNVVDNETEYVGMSANAEQVVVISSSLLGDYVTYNVSLEVKKAYWDYAFVDPEKIVLEDNGSSFVGKFINYDKKIASSQLCLLLYNNTELVNTICSYEFNIEENETVEYDFSYYIDKKYNGLEFTKYELYLGSARYDN